MTLSFEKDVSIYSFSNKNISYRKNYTSCYISEVALIGDHSSAKNDQFHFSNF